MRVMAFGAHPDDELLCAGTLAKYKDQGHEIAIVTVTNGEVGSQTLGKSEIAAIRHQEAQAAADVIGAQLFWLDYPDEFLFNGPEVRLNFINTIRSFNPDIILCPDKDLDYHPDHTMTGQIVWDTHVMVTVPNIKTQQEPCSVIPEIYFMDTAAGVNFSPEHYVDITDQWERKARMYECHASQSNWAQTQYGISFADFGRVQSMFRGFQAGCRFAECFRKPKFFPGCVKPNSLIS